MSASSTQLLLWTFFISVLLLCCLLGIYGDVPDDVVYTDLHITVQKGDSVVLTCRFRGTPLAVYWKKGDDPTTAPNLVSWIPTDDVTGLCKGERPCQIMEMNEDHSLVIKEVSIAEQGRYICRVSNYKGILIHNFTDINVFCPPMEPFPVINECQVISPNNTKTTCTISTSHSVEISCTASSYFPDIDLYFLHGSKSLHTKNTIEITNLDGTKNKTIFAYATPSEISYVCIASDIPGLQEQRTTTVLVNLPKYTSPMPTGPTTQIEKTDGSIAKVVVPVIVVILVLAAICVAIILWSRRKQRRNQEKDDPESKPLRPDTQIKVPEHLLKAISTQEIEEFVYKLTGRHCKRLAKAVGITDEKNVATIMAENNGDLFDTQSMIIDWVDGQECCNYEKRCRLDDAIIEIGRHDMTDSFGTIIYRVKAGGIVQSPHPDAKAFNSTSIFNDDLQVLLKHLPTDSVSLFLERLGISVDEDRDDVEEKLRGWRDVNLRGSKACSLAELILIHKDVLKTTNDELDLKDEELEDVFASISSRKQMDQLMSGLGVDIKEESFTLQHLKEWRDSQDMEKRRETLGKTLHDMELSGCIVNRRPPRHVYKAEMVRLAFSILCTDVGPLAALLNMDSSKGKIVLKPQKGTVGLLLELLERSRALPTHRRRDFCATIRDLGYLDVARLAYFDYDESLSALHNVTSNLSQQEIEMLMKHLDSDKAVLSIGRVRQRCTETCDDLTPLKIWRNRFRPVPYHHTSKFALGLQSIGRTGLADEVLRGKYQTMEISTAVGKDMCNSLDDDQLQRLYVHLGLHATKGQEDRPTKIMTVVEWMKNCVKHFDNIPALESLVKTTFSYRKNENNELFKAGFFELAEEIMLLQYPRFPRIV